MAREWCQGLESCRREDLQDDIDPGKSARERLKAVLYNPDLLDALARATLLAACSGREAGITSEAVFQEVVDALLALRMTLNFVQWWTKVETQATAIMNSRSRDRDEFGTFWNVHGHSFRAICQTARGIRIAWHEQYLEGNRQIKQQRLLSAASQGNVL